MTTVDTTVEATVDEGTARTDAVDGTVGTPPEPDPATRMLRIVNDASACVLTSIGYELGIFDVLAGLPPASPAMVADAAALDERYVREWLGGMVTARFVRYDPTRRTYWLDPDHAPFLTGGGPDNLARMCRIVTLLAHVSPAVVEKFRTGGGLSYADYPGFHELNGQDSGAVHDAALLDTVLPLTGMVDRLREGIRVADVGCGQGHAINLMARAFPSSSFVGYDFSEDALAAGRVEASAWGLSNARFENRDVATPPAEGDRDLDLVTAFDTIHDQAHPATVLTNVHRMLKPGGIFLMVDIKADSNLEANLDLHWATFLYATSTVHCMSVSLGQGGVGLGTVWGVQTAERMVREAGFVDLERHDIEADPFNVYFVARKE